MKDGGSAFPSTKMESIWGESTGREISGGGLTKREWFAGMALVGLIINPNTVEPPKLSERAFEIADAMIDWEK